MPDRGRVSLSRWSCGSYEPQDGALARRVAGAALVALGGRSARGDRRARGSRRPGRSGRRRRAALAAPLGRCRLAGPDEGERAASTGAASTRAASAAAGRGAAARPGRHRRRAPTARDLGRTTQSATRGAGPRTARSSPSTATCCSPLAQGPATRSPTARPIARYCLGAATPNGQVLLGPPVPASGASPSPPTTRTRSNWARARSVSRRIGSLSVDFFIRL